MQCSRCQRDNDPSAKFCEGCGARLARKCSACGTDLSPDARFCKECGAPVGSQQSAPSSPTTPEAYTPKHLAERILTSRAALEGERKQVTVLFADLKGSMELLADRDPEEARAILDPVLERMMEAVHQYEGTVNQVLGDGIMALFGAPLAHEDHALRACYAALALQEAVRQYAEPVRHHQGLEIQARVGLNSGEVVVRAIGNDLHMDYSAIGETTHLAARMEQLAWPGTIRLAPATLRLVEGLVQVHALGPMPVKGRAEPVEVYELVGAAQTRTRLQAAATRGLTRFVGRDAELDVLRRTLEQACAGHGQVVALVGEPGVGKSRLVWEFGHSHRTQGWLVLATGSVSYGQATSYLPVIDLLKQYCGIEARDDLRRMREKVTGKLLTLDPALQPTLPTFLALLDVPFEDASWQALDPPERRQRTLGACKRWLLRECQEQPVLLVCEDLHWIDAETQALLDTLVESLPTARLLLLVNYRPEYAHGWGQKTYYQQLRLDPLPTASADELLEALMGDDASLALLKGLLIERTEGNPFFLEESVRALIETGALVGAPGAYRLTRPVDSTQVPATVQAVLAARIDRLAPENKRLLQCAAVVGRDVPFPLLQAIAELREEWLRQGLADLQAAELLYETRLFPDLEYTFKHALTHEVAYGSLLQERRRALHARIVEAIETLYADRLAEQVERLAHHAVRGALWEKAVSYLRQAGHRAVQQRAAPVEAAAYFEQALVALAQLPESAAQREQAIDLRLELRNPLNVLAAHERTVACLEEAEALAAALGDQRRLGRARAYQTAYYWWLAENGRAAETGQRACAVAGGVGDVGLQVMSNLYLGEAYQALGDYARAVVCFEGNLALLRGELARDRFGMPWLPVENTRTQLIFCLVDCGRFAEAIALGHEAVQLAEESGSPFDYALASGGIGRAYLEAGYLDEAVAWLDRNLAVNTCHLLTAFAWWAPTRGYAYALMGRIAEGLSVLEGAVEWCASQHVLQAHARRLAWLAESHLLANHVPEATAAAEQAVAFAREHRERGNEAWALRAVGEIAAHGDLPTVERAEDYYRQALALADELGMRPLGAHCQLGLGTLYRKVGRDEQAQSELATAAEMYRAMEMPFWLARAETELGQIDSAP